MKNLISVAAKETGGLAVCDQFQDWLCGQNQDCCTKTPAGSLCPVKEEMGGFNYVLALRAMANMATVLSKTTEAAYYESLAMNATHAFHTTFYNAAMGAYGGDQGAVQSLTLPALVIGSPPTADIAKKQLSLLDAEIANPGVGQDPYTLRVGAVTSKVILDVLKNSPFPAAC
jgi:hypothetical protein